MAMDLKSVLETMKKTYSFVVKIAYEGSASDLEKCLNNMDVILKVKGMTKRNQPKSLPLAAAPLDFPRLKGYFGQIYKMEMDFEYPITPNQITNELINSLGLDRAFIIVRTAESPLEQYEEDYLKYKDEDYAVELLKDDENLKIEKEDLYGDEYNQAMVKALQSSEAKKYQQGFSELTKSLYKGFE